MSTADILKIIFRLVFCLLESALLVYGITRSLTPRTTTLPVPFFMTLVTGMTLFFSGMDPLLFMTLLVPVIFLYSLLYFRDRLLKRFVWGSAAILLILVIHYGYIYLLPGIIGFDLETASDDLWFFTGYQLILLRDMAMAVLLMMRIRHPRIRKLTPNLIFAAICLFLVFMTLFTLILERGMPSGYGLRLFFTALLTAGIFLLLLLLYHFMIRFYENEQTERARNLLKEEDIRRQADLNSTYQSMRYLSHDTRKFMQTARQLILNGKAEEGARLLDEYEKQLPIIYATGCTEVDAYLTLVAARCREQNIDFRTELCPLHDLTTDPFDFASLLANLLDNAVESLIQEDPKEKWIDLQLMHVRNMLYIDCKNPTKRTSSILSEEGQIESTKDSANHGLGLKIIREIVEKADGFMSIRIEGGVFQVIIDLPGK